MTFLLSYKNIEKRHLWVRPMGGCNSTLQAAWYVRHAHWARLCYVPFVIWCLWITSTKWLLILCSFHGRPFARVPYVFLIKNIGRWLPWVLQGSTGRFYKDDIVHNHSAHGYDITRVEGRVDIYAWYCYMLNKIKQKWTKPVIHINRESDPVTLRMKVNMSDGTSKIKLR